VVGYAARAAEELSSFRAHSQCKRVNLVPDSGLVAISVLPLNKVAKGKDYNLFYAPKGEHKAATPFARQESSMRTTIRVAAAGLIVAIAFWLNSATSRSVMEGSASKATTTAISIWEIHNLAHLKFLPVQHIEDHSLVFAEKPR
jgi:hypothetical protein